MASTLPQIVTNVQFYLNDSQFSAPTGSQNLAIVNEAYQDFAGLLDFRELSKNDTSLLMVAGQETYTWPTTYVWKDEPYITIKRINQQNYPYRQWPCPDNDTWAAARRTGNSFPYYYRRYAVGSVDTIAFRPVTQFANDIVEIWGQIQVTEFIGDGSAADTTPFLENQFDRALAMWIARRFKLQRKDINGAAMLYAEAMRILPKRQFTPSYSAGEVQPWRG